ncbi:hypothetical protein [Kitasatospora azatica]|uniref:hypothetical protein n=1 Tax=Kitasatospora azatica TaxID=58347 RepID=UPI000566AB75|nr:hypothetical protein [Kitasatospora azatica]
MSNRNPRTSRMTLRVYRVTPTGRRIPRSRQTVRLGEPYTRPITGEWPACRCPRCVASGEQQGQLV